MPLFSRQRTQDQLRHVFQQGLQRGEPYWNFGYSQLTQALPNLRSGLIFLAACENVGKSQFLINLGYNILQSHPDAYWLDFSLDDSVEQRLSYLLARSGDLPIDLVDRAASASSEAQERRRSAFQVFNQRFSGRYCLLADSDAGIDEEGIQHSAEWITGQVRQAREELQTRDKARWDEAGTPEAARIPSRLLVTIDNFHDVSLESRGDDENDRQRRKSQMLKRSATQSNCLYLMTAKTRQDSRARGLTADVVRGDSSLVYDAKVIAHLFSDLNLNREKAELYWQDANRPDPHRYPVLECDILKSKVGGFKGILFYNFLPARCQVYEPDEDTQSYYREVVFGPRNRSS